MWVRYARRLLLKRSRLGPAIELPTVRLKTEAPLIGICLGAQLTARALGARVRPLGVKEIGFAQIALTLEGRSSALALLGEASVLHWHGDQFDIPPGASRLAFTSTGENQAFSFGEFILCLQFHLEADAQKIEQWLVGNYAELAAAGVDPRILRTQAQQFGGQLALASHAAIGSWLEHVETLRAGATKA